MNGININVFQGNTGIFAKNMLNRNTPQIFGQKVKVQTENTRGADSNVQKNADNDTYEHDSLRIQMQNKMKEDSEAKDWVMPGRLGFANYDETKIDKPLDFSELDLFGVAKGVKLSDSAKGLLTDLKKEYKNVDITIADLSTSGQRTYYEGLSDRDKEYSILIDVEEFESFAMDDSSKEHIKSIMKNMFGKKGKLERMPDDKDINASFLAAKQEGTEELQRIEKSLSKDKNQATGFAVKIENTGDKDYVVRLIEDMTEKEDDEKTPAEIQQERIGEKREERQGAVKQQNVAGENVSVIV